MADGHTYPPPDDLNNQNQSGPFYTRANPSDDNSQLIDLEIADDLQLRADLARSLAPIGVGQDDNHQFIDEELLHSSLGYGSDEYARLSLSLAAEGLDQDQDSGDLDDLDKGKDSRAKVSKACDECRRKKVKCDAPVVDGSVICSHCKRLNVSCTFSRQQLKRGPNKGYIKSLADRLKDLEEAAKKQQQGPNIQSSSNTTQSQHQAYSNPPEANNDPELSALTSPNFLSNHMLPTHTNGQKRSLDTFLEDGHATIETQRDRSTASVNNFQQSPNRITADFQDADSILASLLAPSETGVPSAHENDMNNTFSISSLGQQPFFQPRSDVGSYSRYRTSTTVNQDLMMEEPHISDWNRDVVDEYYRMIHQTFPLLPHSVINLKIRLSACPAGLREAFVTILACYMRTYPYHDAKLRANQSYAANLRRAAELIAGYPFDEPSKHTFGTNLVYLQTLILMALECDNHGPATTKGQAGPSRAEWLGRAAGVAGQLGYTAVRPKDSFRNGDDDSDGEEKLARRALWILFILDRWHASSTADLLKLPENSLQLLPEDQILLGESTYHLARLSFIIGHLSSIITTTKTPETNIMAPSNPASHLLNLTLVGEIDRFRESVDSVWGSLNLVHLSYHHVHLLIKRLSPSSLPTDLIAHALRIATLLNQRHTPITPLNHHFGALAGMTLCELVNVPRTRKEAIKGLIELKRALGGGRGLAGHPSDSEGWDEAIRKMIESRLSRIEGVQEGSYLNQPDEQFGFGEGITPINISEAALGLKGNVAAIVAGMEKNGKMRFDATTLMRYGYLTALGQGMFLT